MGEELRPIFVDDGYTEDGLIRCSDQGYQDLRFKYRPLLPVQYGEFLTYADAQNEERARKRMSEIMAQQVTEWSVTNAKGDAVAIRPDNVARLLDPVFVRLWRVITGQSISDHATATKPDPEGEAKN